VNYLEAEDYSSLAGAFVSGLDPAASGGKYMVTPATSSPSATNNYLEYTLQITTAATYYVWIRGQGLSGSANSFYITMDGGGASNGTTSVPIGSWGWVKCGKSFSLSAGTHKLYIRQREAQSRIDRIAVTTDTSATAASFST
jgi:hypothetical protein